MANKNLLGSKKYATHIGTPVCGSVCVCVFHSNAHFCMAPWQLYRHELCELCPIWHIAKICLSLFPFPFLQLSYTCPALGFVPHPLGGVLCLQLALIKTELERVEFRLLFVYLKSSKFSPELQTVNFCCSIIKNFLVVLRSVSSTFY